MVNCKFGAQNKDSEMEFISKMYDSPFMQLTQEEIAALCEDKLEPLPENSSLLNDSYIQNTPNSKCNSSQTISNKKVDRSIQYQALLLSDFSTNHNLQAEVIESLKRVMPLFARAIHENETVDICADYVDIPNGGASIIRSAEDDDAVKALGSYADIAFSKGKTIQFIDSHPTNQDIVAVAVCNPGSSDDIIPTMNSSSPAYIIVWQLQYQIYPLCLLKAPLDCTVFRFNPTQPNIIVGGCRNGTVVLWDMSYEKYDGLLTTSLAMDQRGKDGALCQDRKIVLPGLLSLPEHEHKQMVADIFWLPAHIQISAQGQLLKEEHLTDVSSQFITVAGDGQIMFWDVRFRDILAGKLPYIAKVKPSKQSIHHDDDFPITKWLPLFKIKPKRLEGSGELSLCKAIIPSSTKQHEFKRTQIICASEEGDLLSVDWHPQIKNDKNGAEKEPEREFASQEYVQWMKKDHNRPCIRLLQSSFFQDFALSISVWNFSIWKILDQSEVGISVFTSPKMSSFITGGQWSPTRPGVVYISKVDGTVDVWDFATEGCFTPHATLALIPNCISAMEFTASPKNNIIAVGDKSGTLHMFEIPHHLAHPYPNEKETMRSFLDRETKCVSKRKGGNRREGAVDDSFRVEDTFSTRDKIVVDKHLSEELAGLMQEDLYLEFEKKFLHSLES